MRKFYSLVEKLATVSPKLSYSLELLPYDDINKIAEENNLSIREPRTRIKNKDLKVEICPS